MSDSGIKTSILLLLIFWLTGCSTLGLGPKNPEAAKANLLLGIGYMEKGRLDIAETKLKKSLTFDADNADTHNALGILYEEKGDKKLAEKHFAEAVDLNHDDPRILKNYAHLLCTEQNPAKGTKLLSRAIDLSQDRPLKDRYQLYTTSAICALTIPDHKEAEKFLRKALEINPDDGETLFRLADLSYQQGHYLKARAFLQRYHGTVGYTPESLWLGISIERKLQDNVLLNEYTTLLLSKFSQSEPAQRLKYSE